MSLNSYKSYLSLMAYLQVFISKSLTHTNTQVRKYKITHTHTRVEKRDYVAMGNMMLTHADVSEWGVDFDINTHKP